MAEGQEGGFSMLREVQDLAEKYKEDDEQYISPYAHLEKAAVLQEARYVSKGIETNLDKSNRVESSQIESNRIESNIMMCCCGFVRKGMEWNAIFATALT
jgi:hypothetical protein